jgi:hypothetical protein
MLPTRPLFGPLAGHHSWRGRNTSFKVNTNLRHSGRNIEPNSINCAAPIMPIRAPAAPCANSPIPLKSWLARPQRKQPAPLSAMSVAEVLACPATSRADLAASSFARHLSLAAVSLRSLKSLCSACPRESAKRAAREHRFLRPLPPHPCFLSRLC